MSSPFHFGFKSAAFGQHDFEVFDRQTKTSRRICLTLETGVARYLGEALPSNVLAAFNAWRRETYDQAIAEITKRYGAAVAAQVPPFREAIAA